MPVSVPPLRVVVKAAAALLWLVLWAALAMLAVLPNRP
ncbi:protein of unknown function [Streptomyces murinus]